MENLIEQNSQVSFVSTESSFDEIRRKNFFIYGFIASFVWMCFHFTLVFFFWLKLQSVLLVGMFLGLGNFVSFLVDSPVGVLQKYFPAKKIFISGGVCMLIVSVIFLYFIFSADKPPLGGASIIGTFLGSGFNLLLLLVSVALYGLIKELSDVTSLSYILNNADPSEYAELLSKNNIFSGLGSLTGLITSWLVLSLSIFMAVCVLVGFIILFIIFIIFYFDNSKNTINFNISDIKKLKIISPQETIEAVKQYTISQIQKADFLQFAKNMKFIFLKPMQVREKFNWKEVIETTLDNMKAFYEVLCMKPYNNKLLIITAIIVLFGFWDTFVVTFLIEFLNKIIASDGENIILKVIPITGYIFIAIMAIPAFGAQLPMINLSKKIGTFLIIIFWVLLSAISMFFFGILHGFLPILLVGIVNSIGYASAMPLAQGEFSDIYNQVYAEKRNLTEIDSNASSAPLKMILNLANVVGLIIGGFLIAIFGFDGTFYVLGAILMTIFIVSMRNKRKWRL